VRNRTVLGFIILLTAISSGTHQAQAGLRICNQGNIKFSTAVGYVDRKKGWVANGWLTIDPGECKDALSFALDNRFYYYYARGRDENEHVTYSGENAFCIETRKFKIYQSNYGKSTDEDCAKDGYRSAKFRKVDVSGKPEYTINLGGPDNPPGPGPDPSLANAKPSAAAAPPPAMQQPPAAAVQPPVVRQPPPAAMQQPAPSSGQSGRPDGSACQRFPNLC
jgi:uncharacterized membrane protein